MILPYTQLPNSIQKKISKSQVLDYGIKIQQNSFEFKKNYCIVPNNLVFSYALSLANMGKIGNIFLAGFDGYDKDDPRNLEMNNSINIYYNLKKKKPLTSLTPTKFKLKSRSLFSII